MKKIKILPLLLLALIIFTTYKSIAQPNMVLNWPSRTQRLNHYSDVFISPAFGGQTIGSVYTAIDAANRYFKFNQLTNYYEEILDSHVMLAGHGYVLQIRGNGDYNLVNVQPRVQNFAGIFHNLTYTVPVTAGKFCLLGNPYKAFLDLDSFLLEPSNVNKVTGPVYLWAHNTIISSENINPSDPNAYRYSANDYAMYNVLGGVAAGREISTSVENETFTGIQTPNGLLCFGTGFGMLATTTGSVTFNTTMDYNTTDVQSFRTSDASDTSTKDTTSIASRSLNTPVVRHRVWVNIEKGTIPTVGANTNQLKQLLIGYAACYNTDCATTADNDRVFDAETVTALSNPKIEFYSLADSSIKHLAIQGRDATTFTSSDFFQLGYHVQTTGTYTFTANGDGMFSTTGPVDYFIYDAANGSTNSLPYETNITATTPGTPNETRFRIVFVGDPPKIVTLKLNIEGYYRTATNNMDSVMVNQSTSLNTNEVGDIDVELRNITSPFGIADTANVILQTDGTAIASFSAAANGSYYLSVKHRNAVNTWSATPVTIGPAVINYDFTTAATQAFGSNQVEVEPGVWAFYSGDIDQDYFVDSPDYSLWDADYNLGSIGAFPTDLDGDGFVDLPDYAIWEGNYINGVSSSQP
jgi:hypothetical protein